MNKQKTLAIALSIARQAGDLLRQAYHAPRTNNEIDHKSSGIDLVTQYDRLAEQLLVQELQTHFPEHDIVGEEGGGTTSDAPYVWYIDPIDGTTNFAHRIPFFVVSLALFHEGQPFLGVIMDPLRDECFTAVVGEGAHLHHNDQITPLHVSDAQELRHSVIATGFPYDRHTSELDNLRQFAAFAKRVQGIRRCGAAALDLAYVAAGRFDGYWEYKLNMWDVGAGVLLVQEAGGRVSRIVDRGPFQVEPKTALVAANPILHDEIFAVLDNCTK